jgi:hypothetical protein
MVSTKVTIVSNEFSNTAWKTKLLRWREYLA